MNFVELVIASTLLSLLVFPAILLGGSGFTFRTVVLAFGLSLAAVAAIVTTATVTAGLKRRRSSDIDNPG